MPLKFNDKRDFMTPRLLKSAFDIPSFSSLHHANVMA